MGVAENLRRFYSCFDDRRLLIGIGAVVFILCFLAFGFIGPQDDVRVFYDYSQKAFSGMVPYRDYSLGYPPLSLVIFALPGLFSNDMYSYSVVFAAFVITLFFLSYLTVIKICEEVKADPKIAAFLFLIISSIYMFQAVRKFDIFSTYFLLLSIYFYMKRKETCAYSVAIIGALIKIYPIFMIPVFFLLSVRRKERIKSAFRAMSIVAALGIIGVVALLAFKDLSSFIGYSFTRYFHQESTVGALAQFIGMMGGPAYTTESVDYATVTRGIICDTLYPFWSYVVITVMLSVLIFVGIFIFKNDTGSDKELLRDVVGYGFIIMCIFLLFYQVFSTQFIIWLYPFLPFLAVYDFVGDKSRRLFLITVLMVILSTYIPMYVGDPAVVVILRDITLVYILAESIRCLRPKASGKVNNIRLESDSS